ncbi:hypothetical protein FJTKL_02320 [Diaporthe vaccinii]|uniref:Uncharacterized protein n=1 Tax=Diaporthe vaccinii TaxID=105482 RepID=A0ABR4F482_9PEZI
MECNTAGDTNSVIAGLGIIYAFVVQGGLSVILSLVSVTAEAFQVLARRNLPRFESEKSVKTLILCTNAILSSISQTQIVNGISLLIAAIAQHDELSLYHLHIVYDVVNLTGVSTCTALANLIRAPNFKMSIGPHTYLLRRLYGIEKPNEMSSQALLQHSPIDKVEGLCKMSTKIFLLLISLGQFPVHTYEIFALRHYNEHYLSGDSEDSWGFGQIVALVSLGSTLVQSIGTIIDYFQHSRFEKGDKSGELRERHTPIEDHPIPPMEVPQRVHTMPTMLMDLESLEALGARRRANSS